MVATSTIYGHEYILKNSSSLKCWSNFEIISQKCSYGDPVQKLFGKFGSVMKHGCGKWGVFAQDGHEEILKNSALQPSVKFRLYHRNVPWMSLLKKCSRNLVPSRILALVNGTNLHYVYRHEEILKKFSCLKQLVKIFSSPEQKVLRVSYCDHLPFVVRPSLRRVVVCSHLLVYTLASTNINQSAPNLIQMYMTIRSRMIRLWY